MKRIFVKDAARNVLQLPRLPIPSVQATAGRYTQSLLGLKTPDAAAAHVEKLNNFVESSAPVLQKMLVDVDQAAVASGEAPFSYLAPLLDAQVLGSRAPLVVHARPGLVIKRSSVVQSLGGVEPTQAAVAAGLVHSIACWVKNVVAEGLEVDGKMDMSPVMGEFARSLIPGKDVDTIHVSPMEQLRHVVVLHDGHPYLVKVFDEKQQPLPRERIQKALEHILTITPDLDNASTVSVLTAGSRSIWGQVYQELLRSSPENEATLKKFHDSMIVVCLDSKGWGAPAGSAAEQSASAASAGTPTTEAQTKELFLPEASALHGTMEEVENRWYDKHQLIVSADGHAAFNVDTSSSDRIHWSRWISDVLQLTAANAKSGAAAVATTTADVASMIQPLRITYGKSIVPHIRSARLEASTLVANTDVQSFTLKLDTALLQKKTISIDAFLQLCLQVAQFTLRGRLCAASQLCSTASFFKGSTDLVRTTTAQTHLVAEQTLAQKKSGGSLEGAEQAAKDMSSEKSDTLATLIQQACKSQDALFVQATQGQGIDRHLSALHALAVKNGDKAALAFFDDDLYKMSSDYYLQTSACSQSWLQSYIVGPANDGGYGVGYVVDGSDVRICLTSCVNSPATDAVEMQRAILTSARLLESVLKNHTA